MKKKKNLIWHYLVVATYQEHVVNGVQNDQDDLGILSDQQADDGLQGAALHQGYYLLHGAPAGEVVHHPHGLPLGLEVALLAKSGERKETGRTSFTETWRFQSLIVGALRVFNKHQSLLFRGLSRGTF